MTDLTGKTALVTGSSRGIGRAIATSLARLGADVAVHYGGDRGAAEATLSELPGTSHTIVGADITDPDAVERMVATVVAELGGIDVLVNNAAAIEDHPLTSVSYDAWRAAWRRIVDTNLIGTANVTFCVARHMIEQGHHGRIVNVSSRGAFKGEPDKPAYGASKAGVNSLTGSMAQLLAPHGIVVTAVAPGFVDVGKPTSPLAGPRGDEIRAQSPLNRAARPEEVADVVAFLASAPAYMAGAIVDVNGASYLRS